MRDRCNYLYVLGCCIIDVEKRDPGHWNVHYAATEEQRLSVSLENRSARAKGQRDPFLRRQWQWYFHFVQSIISRCNLPSAKHVLSKFSLSFLVLPRLPDQGCRRSSAVLTLKRVPEVRFLGARPLFYRSANISTSHYLCKWMVPSVRKRGRRGRESNSRQ